MSGEQLRKKFMTEDHKDLLTDNYGWFGEYLAVDDVLPKLIEERIITKDDKANIKAEKTPRAKAEALLDILPSKSDYAFTVFVDALKGANLPLHTLLVGSKDGRSEAGYPVHHPSDAGVEKITRGAAAMSVKSASKSTKQPPAKKKPPKGP